MRALGQREEAAEVTAADRLLLASEDEPAAGVIAERLEHPVAGRVAGYRFGDGKGLSDKAAEHVADLLGGQVGAGAACARRR